MLEEGCWLGAGLVVAVLRVGMDAFGAVRCTARVAVVRNSPPLALNTVCSQIMYKTFAETTYSSCIFYESDLELKYINIKISRSTLGKKKLFHKISGDQFRTLLKLPPACSPACGVRGTLPSMGAAPIAPVPASGFSAFTFEK